MTEQPLPQCYPMWVAFLDLGWTDEEEMITIAEMTDEDIRACVEGPFPVIAWRNCDGLPTPINAITGDSPGARFIAVSYDYALTQAISAGRRTRRDVQRLLTQQDETEKTGD